MTLSQLSKYLPNQSNHFIVKWLQPFPTKITISKERKTKLGDYRKLNQGAHIITINGNLDPDLFLFVLTHEIAHLLAFEKYGRRIKPHGKEWKQCYRDLLAESIFAYPKDLRTLIVGYARAPKANFMSYSPIVNYFYNDKKAKFLENIPIGEQFIFRKERYVNIKKLKKNYLCQSLKTGLKYRIHPLAEVDKID